MAHDEMLRFMSRGHIAAALAAVSLALAAPAAARADSFPLVGWWPMNEGSGQNVYDWSLHGNNGFLGSSTAPDAHDPSWIKGVFLGSALRFDGVDDFVSIPDSKSLEPQNLTVAAWVRGTGPRTDYRYIVSKGASACDRSSYGLYTGATGGVGFYVSDSSTFYSTPQTAPTIWDGNWHNVAGTFDGHVVRLYVDGVQIGTGTPAETTIDYSFPTENGMVGGFPGTCSSSLTLNGDIDGVQIWSRALPVDTIWQSLKSLFTASR
jgi:hypothetical protein